MAGELTLRQALRIAKPDKYPKRDKRDKAEQWLASYRAWSTADKARAIETLTHELECEQ